MKNASVCTNRASASRLCCTKVVSYAPYWHFPASSMSTTGHILMKVAEFCYFVVLYNLYLCLSVHSVILHAHLLGIGVIHLYPGWLVVSNHIWHKSEIAKNNGTKSALLIVAFAETSLGSSKAKLLKETLLTAILLNVLSSHVTNCETANTFT